MFGGRKREISDVWRSREDWNKGYIRCFVV